MQPAVILVPVPDWHAGFAWYRQAFPGAVSVSLPNSEFKALALGNFVIEIVPSDAKVPSAKAGTVLYWHVGNLREAIAQFELLGSEVYRGPMKIEHGLGMCQVTDTFGNLIGLRGLFL